MAEVGSSLEPDQPSKVAPCFATLAIITSIQCCLILSVPLSSLPSDIAFGWTDVTSAVSPPRMAGAMMAYSTKSERFVLFGGWDGREGLNGTWIYDPRNLTWVSVQPAVSPPGRGDAMFVYDGVSDIFVLFGGWHENTDGTYTRLGDTWMFSLTNHIWSEVQPARSPSARSDSQVAYDPLADVVFLFGGFNGTTYLSDNWYYSVVNNTWSSRPASVSPSPRADGRMIYVESQDRFIIFGGNDFSGPNYTFHHLSDTWSYRWGTDVWTHLDHSTGPSARDYPVFAVDQTAGRALLTSGFGERIILNDLWAFDLSKDTWLDLSPQVSPPARFAAVGGFDPVKQALVIFGGLADTGLLADTWQYTGGIPSTTPNLVPVALAVAGVLTVVGVVAVRMVLRTKGRRS